MASNVAGKSRLGHIAIAVLSFTLTPSVASALDLAEIESRRALWQSQNIADYDFVLGRSCFCDPDFTRPGLVMVRMNSIVAVFDAQTHEPRRLQDFFTIDAAFDSLRDSLLFQPTTLVIAEFDPQLGYPRRIRFDDPGLFDDDITFGIFDFRVVPEPASLVLIVSAVATCTARRSSRRNVAG
jgi:hypothetical protein